MVRSKLFLSAQRTPMNIDTARVQGVQYLIELHYNVTRLIAKLGQDMNILYIHCSLTRFIILLQYLFGMFR